MQNFPILLQKTNKEIPGFLNNHVATFIFETDLIDVSNYSRMFIAAKLSGTSTNLTGIFKIQFGAAPLDGDINKIIWCDQYKDNVQNLIFQSTSQNNAGFNFNPNCKYIRLVWDYNSGTGTAFLSCDINLSS